jgi:hypothetical protein
VKKIYLAARFSAQQEMQGVRDVLTAVGFEITSSWIDHVSASGVNGITVKEINAEPERCGQAAAGDMADVLAADTLILFTEWPSTTGGRHVELGIALGAGKRVIIVGDLENIFQALPQVEHYPDWPSLATALADGPQEAAPCSSCGMDDAECLDHLKQHGVACCPTCSFHVTHESV